MQNSSAVTRHAILINYLAAALVGIFLFDINWGLQSRSWFLPAAVEGVGFYLVFRMIALTTQRSGITIASIATKMSVVIPTLIGIIALGESVSVFKISGLFFGIASVLFAVGLRFRLSSLNESDSPGDATPSDATIWLLPLLVFVCTGLIDASLKLFQIHGLTDTQFPAFVMTIFSFAFVAAFIHHLTLPNKAISMASACFGVVLGLANMGTVYFMLKALALPGWESSIVYPLNNFGIVLTSTLAGVLIFREHLTFTTKISLCFAVSSIALLYAAS